MLAGALWEKRCVDPYGVRLQAECSLTSGTICSMPAFHGWQKNSQR
ncbi:hypothetical protein C4K39_3338 [Pseudomonas sessilinigenes]|nr:hypothetical protein C4K39_3338 [Pseudomonas sessilinigenes]